jgi:hypothetical protein
MLGTPDDIEALKAERAARLAAEDELRAKMAAKEAASEVKAHSRKKPSRKPLPEDLPRERVVIPGPTSCDCCGSTKLAKLGEDVTETLEAQHSLVRMLRPGSGRRSNMSEKNSPAGIARASRSRPHLSL